MSDRFGIKNRLNIITDFKIFHLTGVKRIEAISLETARKIEGGLAAQFSR